MKSLPVEVMQLPAGVAQTCADGNKCFISSTLSPRRRLLPSLLFVTQHFPPRYTGEGKFVARLVPRLDALGHAVTIACEDAQGARSDPAAVRIIRFPSLVKSRRLRRLGFCTGVTVGLLLRRLVPEVVLTDVDPMLIPFLWIAKKRGSRWVYRTTLFGSDDACQLSRSASGRCWLKFLNRADSIVCASDLFHQSFANHGYRATQLSVIPYGIDTTAFRPATAEEQNVLRSHLGIIGGPVVVFVGQIARRKGIDLLAEAWKRVLNTWPRAKLLLVGPIPSESKRHRVFLEEVRRIFASYSGLESICFVGEVQDPSPYVRASDLFVLPSRQEGLPNVVLEAEACSKPIVTTRFIGYTPFLGKHRQELMVVEPTAESLAAGLCEVLGDVPLQESLARNALDYARQRFSLEVVAQAYSSLVQSLCAEGHQDGSS